VVKRSIEDRTGTESTHWHVNRRDWSGRGKPLIPQLRSPAEGANALLNEWLCDAAVYAHNVGDIPLHQRLIDAGLPSRTTRSTVTCLRPADAPAHETAKGRLLTLFTTPESVGCHRAHVDKLGIGTLRPV
jgi:hypothetical protein